MFVFLLLFLASGGQSRCMKKVWRKTKWMKRVHKHTANRTCYHLTQHRYCLDALCSIARFVQNIVEVYQLMQEENQLDRLKWRFQLLLLLFRFGSCCWLKPIAHGLIHKLRFQTVPRYLRCFVIHLMNSIEQEKRLRRKIKKGCGFALLVMESRGSAAGGVLVRFHLYASYLLVQRVVFLKITANMVFRGTKKTIYLR